MTRAISTLGFLFSIAQGLAQNPAQTFEAASIKPSKVGNDSSSWHTRLGYVVMKNQTLKTLVGIAYAVTDDKVLDGPKWIGSERFDVEARAAGPAKDAELLLMLRSILAER